MFNRQIEKVDGCCRKFVCTASQQDFELPLREMLGKGAAIGLFRCSAAGTLMSDELPAIRIRAFVSRSFLPEDEAVWLEIRNVLESLRPLGFVFEDVRAAQLTPVSEKVRQGIQRNDFLIAILTRRLPIRTEPYESKFFKRILRAVTPHIGNSSWTTSNWVIQESGFALGKDKEVLLLIENGVEFPTTALDADTEWIAFDRSQIPRITTRLVSMISNLISAKLPTVPAAAQESPPAETTSLEEEPEQTLPGADFGQVVHLLDQGEFQQADQEFRNFLKFIRPNGEGSDDNWWNCFYLRLKAIRGHTDSLHKLKSIIDKEPKNIDALIELAHYYSHFNDSNRAARLLIDSANGAEIDSKAKLLRQAAEELAKDKQSARALEMVREVIGILTDPTQLRLTYLALADIAKGHSDRDLESAALERVLDFDPADSAIRFRLAYLYSQIEQPHLAAYHYNLRLNQGLDHTTLNNLGIAYGKLKLPGREIAVLLRASEDYWLARANLSDAYVDRGFLSRGEELATQVTKADCDETARIRAMAVLRRISTIRSNEKRTEEEILLGGKTQRLFLSAYAEAYAAPSGIPVMERLERRMARSHSSRKETGLRVKER